LIFSSLEKGAVKVPEIVDSFTSKMAEAVPAVAVQAEVWSFHSELAFTLFTV